MIRDVSSIWCHLWVIAGTTLLTVRYSLVSTEGTIDLSGIRDRRIIWCHLWAIAGTTLLTVQYSLVSSEGNID